MDWMTKRAITGAAAALALAAGHALAGGCGASCPTDASSQTQHEPSEDAAFELGSLPGVLGELGALAGLGEEFGAQLQAEITAQMEEALAEAGVTFQIVNDDEDEDNDDDDHDEDEDDDEDDEIVTLLRSMGGAGGSGIMIFKTFGDDTQGGDANCACDCHGKQGKAQGGKKRMGVRIGGPAAGFGTGMTWLHGDADGPKVFRKVIGPAAKGDAKKRIEIKRLGGTHGPGGSHDPRANIKEGREVRGTIALRGPDGEVKTFNLGGPDETGAKHRAMIELERQHGAKARGGKGEKARGGKAGREGQRRIELRGLESLRGLEAIRPPTPPRPPAMGRALGERRVDDQDIKVRREGNTIIIEIETPGPGEAQPAKRRRSTTGEPSAPSVQPASATVPHDLM